MPTPRAPLLLACLLCACAHASAPALSLKAPAPPAAQPPPAVDGELPPPPDASSGGLWSKRIDFVGSAPVLPIRLMERATVIRFSGRGRVRFRIREQGLEKTVEGPAEAQWSVRLQPGARAATVLGRIQVAEFPFADKAGLAASQAEWAAKGLKLKPQILGGVYAIAGKVIDNRRYLLLVDAPAARPEAVAVAQAELLKAQGLRTTLLEELRERPHGRLELLDAGGAVLATSEDALLAESVEGAPFDVKKVEFGVGYDNHGFEDRAYRGALQLTVDRQGLLGLVNLIPLEAFLKGLVPSEIFAKAHPEALKAQAVTARGEVLAKVGLKHLADPYLLCTEQHCAVYRGLSGEAPSTNAAVEATTGEMLFDASGHLVDSVYSAVCGGHTEDNDVVWGGPPNLSLRGRPDIIPGMTASTSPARLTEFLATQAPHACRLSSFAQPSRYRWEKRLPAAELDAKLASLGVGAVFALGVVERGVSGRVRLLNISGEAGATQVRGELTIRKLLGNLNSAMFEVRVEKDAKGRPTAWIFTGGGWGHGVGMCQTGAIGRAEAGQSYREILGHYFNGAIVSRVY